MTFNTHMKNRLFPPIVSVAVSTLVAAVGAHAASPVISDPASTSIGIITGGDAGEGLDLDGNFAYAFSLGADTSQSVQVRDATFLGVLDTDIPGVTVSAGNTILNWYVINYGDSQNDDNLELATSSI